MLASQTSATSSTGCYEGSVVVGPASAVTVPDTRVVGVRLSCAGLRIAVIGIGRLRRAKLVRQRLAKQRARIEAFCLPSDSPELNLTSA